MPPGPYAPKPPRGPLGDRVDKAAPEERAKVKAQILVEHNKSRTFEHDGIRYTLNNIKLVSKQDGVLVDDPNGDVLHVHVTAVKLGAGGGPIELNNPFLFVNAPYQVPDGTWHKEERPNPDGTTEQVDAPNLVENPVVALEAAIAQTVNR